MAVGIGRVVAALSATTFSRGPRDDDFVDRLNHLGLHGFLIFLALFTGTKQFSGSPIYCWLPANYDEKYHRRFANNYCWVRSLYNVPFEETIPTEEASRYNQDVAYYRWATVVFLVLAVLFRAPQLIWKELKHFCGVNIDKLVDMTTQTTMMTQDKRDEQLSHVAEFIHRWVTTRRQLNRSGRFAHLQSSVASYFVCYGKRSGHNLVITYLLVKVLYLVNSVGQFFIISRILKINYWNFGTRALTSYLQQGEWQDETVFPRVALCDMKIRLLANVYTYTMQCVLGLNIFLEKFFFILWFLLIFILIANAVSLGKWAFLLLQESKMSEFWATYIVHLFPRRSSSNKDLQLFKQMGRSYLGMDGLFVVKMIAQNASELLTVDLVRQIWLRYKTYLDSEAPQKVLEEDVSRKEEGIVERNGGARIQLDDVDRRALS